MKHTRSSRADSPGHLLRLIRAGEATTRVELAEATGLARSTVTQRLKGLAADGWVIEVGEAASTGGRPATILGFNANAGVVLVADLGATHCHLAVSDLNADPLHEMAFDLDIAAGPDHVLGVVNDRFDDLLTAAGRGHGEVLAIGIGVPGPVEFAAGRAISPPIMPGWDRYPIRDRFSDRYAGPVLVDNDVNIMALGEFWAMTPKPHDLLFVKVGTGIGAGIVLGGRLHRGVLGAAGDVGHVQVVSDGDVLCACGNTGCLEAVAGGRAIARRLAADGRATSTSRDVVRLANEGDSLAIQAVREAGRTIGGVLATTVNVLNPDVVVIGGDVVNAGEQLLAGIREAVYRRSNALATSRLEVVPSALGDRAGVIGAAAMAIEQVLHPDNVDLQLSELPTSLSAS